MNSQIERLKGVKGAYALMIELVECRTIKIGKAGSASFPRGHYVYIGSALGRTATSLGWRLARYRDIAGRKKKWHIDYLLADISAKIRRIEYAETVESSECNISLVISSKEWAEVPLSGLGASDCREGCPAHLYRVNLNTLDALSREIGKAFKESGLDPKELVLDWR
ncbi:MAG TPA: GIY-YIG nuclease family protein [Candidatus Bathyarchaeia archaeon]|nr:GIY-YIG nuclease family protein [Candidatus Bathyarchaeia archaeon]